MITLKESWEFPEDTGFLIGNRVAKQPNILKEDGGEVLAPGWCPAYADCSFLFL